MKKIAPVNYLVREPNEPHNEVNYHVNEMRPYTPSREVEYPESESDLDEDDLGE